jgi:hypothetical protein
MMTRLPSAETVLASAHRVLEDQGTVVSLRRFLERVRAGVQGAEPGRPLGPQRLRRMMAQASFCRLQIRTRLARDQPTPSRCPVCGRALRPVRNRTLEGGVVEIAVSCPLCPYRSAGGRRVPTLYTFHHRPDAARKPC